MYEILLNRGSATPAHLWSQHPLRSPSWLTASVGYLGAALGPVRLHSTECAVPGSAATAEMFSSPWRLILMKPTACSRSYDTRSWACRGWQFDSLRSSPPIACTPIFLYNTSGVAEFTAVKDASGLEEPCIENTASPLP
ncbi:hypothetical protein S7711_10572 [Stachybotrys chartarum IBT 7711]|uniref:Uncharacterized protein n=1 Tax=Stachybotrys chartarum (strain CBS 109288 / IBT 7711) TaxID=1280523 RepID=A0A084AQD9_STACB|nr:hypothetical protein S7711_10572 [Stachybotrys chartarum IBT 7711]KFA48607.1 hypothetical protein S40293_10367 [Stachybotrys chartarum IBT 40293]